jgi:hypothetical protein
MVVSVVGLVVVQGPTMVPVIDLNLRREGNVVPSGEALDCCPELHFSMRRQREGASPAAARQW